MAENQNISNNPLYRTLAIVTDGTTLHAMERSKVDDSDCTSYPVTLDPTAGSTLAALEEAVYSVPSLLSDYAQVDVLFRTPSFTIVPSALKESAEAVATIAGILGEDDVLHIDTISGVDALMVWTLPTDIHNFIARTFRNPRLRHPLSILGSYFARKCPLGNSAKTFVHFNGNSSVDIIAFSSDGRLLSMGTKTTPTDNDALYMILATLRDNHFGMGTDELFLCGDHARREVLTPTLRRYIRSVLPLIFPSTAYRTGDAASAPFPLIILPLCE